MEAWIWRSALLWNWQKGRHNSAKQGVPQPKYFILKIILSVINLVINLCASIKNQSNNKATTKPKSNRTIDKTVKYRTSCILWRVQPLFTYKCSFFLLFFFSPTHFQKSSPFILSSPRTGRPVWWSLLRIWSFIVMSYRTAKLSYSQSTSSGLNTVDRCPHQQLYPRQS